MPKDARMLVFPGPPKILPQNAVGETGRIGDAEARSEVVVVRGSKVVGMPGSPGTTQPVGAVGNWVDCKPGTMVSILPWVSYQGMLTSQRTPRFSVRFGFTFQES